MDLASFAEDEIQGYIKFWHTSLGPQPTEQQVADAASGITTVGGRTFIQWKALRPQLERRESAKEKLASLRGEGAVLRAMILTMLDEMNLHANRVNALLTAIDNASTLATLKTAVALINDIPQRTGLQLRNAIISKLDAGDGDA